MGGADGQDSATTKRMNLIATFFCICSSIDRPFTLSYTKVFEINTTEYLASQLSVFEHIFARQYMILQPFCAMFTHASEHDVCDMRRADSTPV